MIVEEIKQKRKEKKEKQRMTLRVHPKNLSSSITKNLLTILTQ